MNDKDNSEFRLMLEEALAAFELDTLTEKQLNQLAEHYSMLCHWNRRINLTRIVESNLAANHHYAESVFGGRFLGDASTILDIGAGAGFPSIPLAVLRPDVLVTAIEANNKKALFLEEAKHALSLSNFEIVKKRLEGFDRSSYDILASRALDRAESVFPEVIAQLVQRQRLMLYCVPELIASLSRNIGSEYIIETHPIPRSESRLIAIFYRS